MKNPLSYQLTEYDCGPTTMLNAINFLFARNEIPPDVINLLCSIAWMAMIAKENQAKVVQQAWL